MLIYPSLQYKSKLELDILCHNKMFSNQKNSIIGVEFSANYTINIDKKTFHNKLSRILDGTLSNFCSCFAKDVYDVKII